MPHFASASCEGKRCHCGKPASHKLEESIMHDDPSNTWQPFPGRHPLTAYVCCEHFRAVLGPATGCPVTP